MGKKVLMQGNEACVMGAIAAGMRFFAGYPITPSTEIAEISAQELPKVGGRFLQMEDEISGAAAAIGASVAGVKAMTATSGPGFSLKQGFCKSCAVNSDMLGFLGKKCRAFRNFFHYPLAETVKM